MDDAELPEGTENMREIPTDDDTMSIRVGMPRMDEMIGTDENGSYVLKFPVAETPGKHNVVRMMHGLAIATYLRTDGQIGVFFGGSAYDGSDFEANHAIELLNAGARIIEKMTE